MPDSSNDMNKIAWIRSEAHIDLMKDLQNMVDQNLDRVDGIFLEGREEKFRERELSINYIFYVFFNLGTIIWKCILKIMRLILGRNSRKQVIKDLNFNNIYVTKNIDLTMPEIYNNFKKSFISSFIVTMVLISIFYYFGGLLYLARFSFLISILLVIFFIGFSSLAGLVFTILIDSTYYHKRESEMAKNINRTANQQNLKNIIINVGSDHKKTLETKLTEKGWKVKKADQLLK